MGTDVRLDALTFGAGRSVKPVARPLVSRRMATQTHPERFRRFAPGVIFGAEAAREDLKRLDTCGG